jgi:hypothetical protein
MAFSFARVIRADNNGVVVEGSDGRTYTITGSRSLRNNNPGAIAWSPVAQQYGAIGYDTVAVNGQPSTRLAIFPTMEAGQQAQHELLFGTGSNHPQYSGMTLQQAISRYAPRGADGNPPPQSYYNRIAAELGVSVNTKLSDLTPAQQQQFMQVQANIESGGRGQIITDSQGNHVQFPPADIPNPPNSSGGPDDRSLSGYPTNHTPIPLAPSRSPAALGGNAADNLIFGSSFPSSLQSSPASNAADSLGFNPVYPDMSNALPLASMGDDGHIYMPSTTPIANISGSPDDRDSSAIDAMGGGSLGLTPFPTGAGALPLPSSLPPLPLPRPADAPTPLPTAPQTAPAQTVQINGHTYTVGQVLSTADGRSYQATPNGFVAMPHISLGTNTIAGGIAGQAVKDALATAQQQAPSAIAGAASKIGGLFGGLTNLFGGTSASTPNGGAPVPPLDVPSAGVPQTYGPAGGYYSPPPLPGVPQTYGPAGGFYSPPTTPFSNPGVQGLSPDDRDSYSGSAVDLGVAPPALPQTAPAAPQTIASKVQVLNPAYTSWLNDQNSAIYGVQGVDTPSLDANGNVTLPSSYLGAQTPAPAKYIYKTVYKPNPAYRAPPLDTRPQIAGIPIGHPGGLLSLLNGGLGNRSTPDQVKSVYSNLTPAQLAGTNPAALAAARNGDLGYVNNSGTLMPTTTVSGGFRYSYADNPPTSYGGSNNFARTGST